MIWVGSDKDTYIYNYIQIFPHVQPFNAVIFFCVIAITSLRMKNMISTPLRIEKPVISPIVPPTILSADSNVTYAVKVFPFLNTLQYSTQINMYLNKLRAGWMSKIDLEILFNFIKGWGVKVDLNHFQRSGRDNYCWEGAWLLSAKPII